MVQNLSFCDALHVAENYWFYFAQDRVSVCQNKLERLPNLSEGKFMLLVSYSFSTTVIYIITLNGME